MNSWFEVVHLRREMFVANTLAEIAQVFPDHQLIGSLGCGSVVNLPIVLGDQLVATMNILNREHHRIGFQRSERRSPCPPRWRCLLPEGLRLDGCASNRWDVEAMARVSRPERTLEKLTTQSAQ
jgi:hypothetical protein